MTKQKNIFIIGLLIFVSELFVFRNNLFPGYIYNLKVKGQACTCPDEKVLEGQEYLISITPDSLKKYNLDFSEIFVNEMPSSNYDQMGVHVYFINGMVIGKERGSEYDSWNPKLRITDWVEEDKSFEKITIVFLLFQLVIWLLLLQKFRR